MTTPHRFFWRGMIVAAVAILVPSSLLADEALDKARALVGVEYAPRTTPFPIPGTGCIEQGGQLIYIDNREVQGWSIGVMTCSGRWVYAMTQQIGYEDDYPKWRIVDSLLVPPLAKGAHIYQSGDCELDGKIGTTFFAVVRFGRRDRVDHRTGVSAAWSFDAEAGKLVTISPRRVVCYRPTPP